MCLTATNYEPPLPLWLLKPGLVCIWIIGCLVVIGLVAVLADGVGQHWVKQASPACSPHACLESRAIFFLISSLGSRRFFGVFLKSSTFSFSGFFESGKILFINRSK